jgi:hypothetical protein
MGSHRPVSALQRSSEDRLLTILLRPAVRLLNTPRTEASQALLGCRSPLIGLPQSRMTSRSGSVAVRTLAYTSLAMVALSTKSVLCRAALGQSLIDASSFTVIRVVFGPATLWLIWTLSGSQRGNLFVDWRSALECLTSLADCLAYSAFC